VNPGDPAFFRRLRELCDRHSILLIFDEVQIGVGRSGALWGYEQLGVEPDAITLAKGLGGGIPIGALAVKRSVDHFRQGDHASTFGGNPFACRAALTVVQELERRALVPHVAAMGMVLQSLLRDLVDQRPHQLEGVRGWGLLQGLLLKADSELTAPEIALRAIEAGLLVVPAGPRVVRFVPPLVIRPKHLRLAVSRLAQTLDALAGA
jgi:acetylornithine aminotransferase